MILTRKGLYLSWLEGLTHNQEVVGSSPTGPTMKQEISEYYKKKGYDVVYINTNKEPRRVATLRKSDGTMTSMSYAKYLYTSHYETDIPKGDEVDHINGDDEKLKVAVPKCVFEKRHLLKDFIESFWWLLTCCLGGAGVRMGVGLFSRIMGPRYLLYHIFIN